MLGTKNTSDLYLVGSDRVSKSQIISATATLPQIKACLSVKDLVSSF